MTDRSQMKTDGYKSIGGGLSGLVHAGTLSEDRAIELLTSIQIACRVPDTSKPRDAMLHEFDGNLQYLRDYHQLPPRRPETNEGSDPTCECQHCGWTGRESEMTVTVESAPDLFQRIAPGEIVPAGECPECDCLAHPVINAATDWKTPESAGDAND